MSRLSYEDSYAKLQDDFIPAGPIPAMPESMPCFVDAADDNHKEVGFRLYLKLVEEVDFSYLTLCRSFIGRSEINECSFHNTDLSESNMTWNNFIAVDFSQAVLVNCDMRSSFYEEVNFVEADLSRADLRQSSFEDCDFTDAIMQGTILTQIQGGVLNLSEEQRAAIAWTDDEGDEPEGGE